VVAESNFRAGAGELIRISPVAAGFEANFNAGKNA
jgi:hypothetical protein